MGRKRKRWKGQGQDGKKGEKMERTRSRCEEKVRRWKGQGQDVKKGEKMYRTRSRCEER